MYILTIKHAVGSEVIFCWGLCPKTKSAYGLLKSAIRDDDPVVMLESEMMYGFKGEVPDEEFLTPLGKAEIRRAGADLTLITYSKPLWMTLDAAAELAKQGYEAEVLDLRSLRPLDEAAIYESVRKTNRCVVVTGILAPGQRVLCRVPRLPELFRQPGRAGGDRLGGGCTHAL